MVGRGASRVPERWTDYIPLGWRMPGTRFIAFKVPLKKSFDRNLLPEERFSPHDLIRKVKEQKEELGLIIDLTYTTRYYGPEELPPTLCYSKILTMGHEIPNKETIFRFKYVVKKFLRDNKDNDKLIGVHCTHGLNRTGYLVCRYLIDVEGMEPNTAIELFNKSRGHPIERTNYIQDLQKRAWKRKKGSATAKPQKQLVKHPQHCSTQSPLAVPRNLDGVKKKQQPGSKAQAQPQQLGQRYGALEQKLQKKQRQLQQRQLEQRQQRELEQWQLEQRQLEQKKLKKLQQRELEQRELEQRQLEQKKLKKLQQRQLEQRELEQRQLEQRQLEQKQLKKLQQRELEQRQLEQKQLKKLEQRQLEQKQLKKLQQRQLEQKQLKKLQQRQLEQKQLKKLEQRQLEQRELEQRQLEQRQLEQKQLKLQQREPCSLAPRNCCVSPPTKKKHKGLFPPQNPHPSPPQEPTPVRKRRRRHKKHKLMEEEMS